MSVPRACPGCGQPDEFGHRGSFAIWIDRGRYDGDAREDDPTHDSRANRFALKTARETYRSAGDGDLAAQTRRRPRAR